MKSIEDIYKLIEKENIIYEEKNLSKINSKGIYIQVDGLSVIAIDSSILNGNCTYISIMAEELGHHFTTTGNLIEPSKNYMEKIIKSKKELLARKWAANYLISDEEFVQAILNCINNKDDFCNYFNITYEVLENKIRAIALNEEKFNLIKSKLREYEVQFNSCTI